MAEKIVFKFLSPLSGQTRYIKWFPHSWESTFVPEISVPRQEIKQVKNSQLVDSFSQRIQCLVVSFLHLFFFSCCDYEI